LGSGTGQKSNEFPAFANTRTLYAIEATTKLMRKIFLFLFLTATFLVTSCASSRKQADCEKFKTGRFELRSELDNSITTIERNDSIQTETSNKTGHITKARIKWIADCEYELTYFAQTTNSSDTIVPFVQSRPLKTTILQTGKDYYIFKSSMEGTNVTLVDTLKVVR
jgi:hypothetical protein